MADPEKLHAPDRGQSWRWWVCGLLLLATMLNYMDRLTLNILGPRIMRELGLDAAQYGQLESIFAYAFALGAIVFGWVCDRTNVRWVYPAAVVAWSMAGFATGLAHGFLGLLLCRFLLGFAEAGNWPSALRTTQHILPPQKRALGNGILQSGAAIGAVLTPLVIMYFVEGADSHLYLPWAASAWGRTLCDGMAGVPGPVVASNWLALPEEPGAWRPPFLVIGGIGLTWAILWLVSVRSRDLEMPRRVAPSLVSVLGLLLVLFGLDIAMRIVMATWGGSGKTGLPLVVLSLLVKFIVCVVGITGVCRWLLGVTADETSLPRPVFIRRFAVLITLVISINVTWHFYRAWLPLFLRDMHEYGEEARSRFFLLYYLSSDLGSLTVGFVALGLVRWGASVHGSRLAVFGACAVITTLGVLVGFIETEWVLVSTLLVIAFAALGLFPPYYSFSQELTTRHQGKLTGALGCINWLAMYLLQEVVGETVKQTGRYEVGLALAGLAPLVGFLVVLCFWGGEQRSEAT